MTGMPQWRAGANEIAALIEQADGVGKVHVGEEDVKTLMAIMELATTPQTDLEMLEEQGKVNFWQIGRIAVGIERRQLPRGQSYRTHQLVIRGYLGEGEGSWEKFQEITDSVMTSLENLTEVPRSDSLTDLVEVDAFQVTNIGRTLFGPYSCHALEGRIVLRERRKSAVTSGV